jgi:hypothetical protein
MMNHEYVGFTVDDVSQMESYESGTRRYVIRIKLHSKNDEIVFHFIGLGLNARFIDCQLEMFGIPKDEYNERIFMHYNKSIRAKVEEVDFIDRKFFRLAECR